MGSRTPLLLQQIHSRRQAFHELIVVIGQGVYFTGY
jgi:hypothetical protein